MVRPRLTVLSGVGGKAASCFLLEAGGARLLLDLGRVPGIRGNPCLSQVGRIDAILLTHMHPDHAGGLDLAREVGNPPVFATALTARSLGLSDVRQLPLRGALEVSGLTVSTGRNGHAPGGVWVHVGAGDGLLFSGDLGFRSALYPLDAPPPAATAVLDASFGTRDDPEGSHLVRLEEALSGPTPLLLPAPAWGRGPELALAVYRLGARFVADRELLCVLDALATETDALLPGREGELAELRAKVGDAETATPASDLVVLTSDAAAEQGPTAAWCERLAGGRGAIRFTGHRPVGSAAERLVAAGEAKVLPWPVHPMLAENVELLRRIGARQALAAYCEPAVFPELAQAFGDRVRLAEGPEVPL